MTRTSSTEQNDIEKQKWDDSDIEAWNEADEETPEEVAEISGQAVGHSPLQIRIVRSSLDFTLHTLRQSLADSTYINLSPSYQRRNRWDRKKRSQLIESLLLNIPIPPIFLFETDLNQYEIMDGRQRIEAIRGFLDNNYSLTGLEYLGELQSKRFKDLSDETQRGLLRRSINAIVLLAETQQSKDSKFDVRMALFKRLNTGGVRLNAQELRNALYPSLFNDMLIDLTKLDIFKSTWRIPAHPVNDEAPISKELEKNALYKTMADCELVLRYFAIKETVQEKRFGSLRSIMDSTMVAHCSDNADTVILMRTEYEAALTVLYDVFDRLPFVSPRTDWPSRAVYDAMMVGASLTGVDELPERKASIQAKFKSAMEKDESYDILVGRGNSVEAIKDRVELAKQILA